MLIVQDTREQKPLDFSAIPARPKVVVATLATGDYSIQGMESVVCLERKSIADLVDTLVRDLSKQHKGTVGRFAKELERMRAYKYAAIVVEGTRRDIFQHRYVSKVPPRMIEAMIDFIWVGSGIPTFWCDDAEITAECVYSILKQVYKKETTCAKSSATTDNTEKS